MAESDPENTRAIRETLASFAGQPMFLAGSYVFLRTSESFLFDRRAGGYQCRGFRSELIVTAHCSWKIVRDGVVLVRSWQPSNGRRYRSWRAWIPRRSRLLERFFDDEGNGTGDVRGVGIPLTMRSRGGVCMPIPGWFVLRSALVVVLLASGVHGEDFRRSWLSCVEELSLPVVNDMNRATFRGHGRHSVVLDLVLDKEARVDLAPDWKAPETKTIPLSLMLSFVSNQVYRKECAGMRFKVSISMVLVDRYAGRQDSRIKNDNTIELYYHDNGSNE